MIVLLFCLSAVAAEKFCIEPKINESMVLHTSSNGGVFSSGTKNLVDRAAPIEGLAFPSKEGFRGVHDWCGFGDSRTDKAAQCQGGTGLVPCKDVPGDKYALLDRFSSLSGAAIFESFIGPPGQQVHLYKGEGRYKVFYEGVNNFGSNCLFAENAPSDITGFAGAFYTELYTKAQIYRNMELMNFAVTEAGSPSGGNAGDTTVRTVSLAACYGGGFLANPKWTMPTSPLPAQGCVTIDETFVVPSQNSYGPVSGCSVAFCRWVIKKADFTRQHCGDYMSSVRNQDGVTVFSYDYGKDGYPNPATTHLTCEMRELRPGTYRMNTNGFALKPTRGVCWGVPQKRTPVFVVDSVWKQRTLEVHTGQICSQVEGCIRYTKKTPYEGLNDPEHGDSEIRGLFSTLDKMNASCVTGDYRHFEEGHVLMDREMSVPLVGRCPLYVEEKFVPKIPDGIMIRQSGTIVDQTKETRIFGIDDLLIGLGILVVGLVSGGAGYYFGSKAGSGGSGVPITHEDIAKMKENFKILGERIDTTQKELSGRIIKEDHAIIGLYQEVAELKRAELIDQLELMRELITANISTQLSDHLREQIEMITEHSGGLAKPVGTGCWEIDTTVCDEGCVRKVIGLEPFVLNDTSKPLNFDFGNSPEIQHASFWITIATFVISSVALVLALIAMRR